MRFVYWNLALFRLYGIFLLQRLVLVSGANLSFLFVFGFAQTDHLISKPPKKDVDKQRTLRYLPSGL